MRNRAVMVCCCTRSVQPQVRILRGGAKAMGEAEQAMFRQVPIAHSDQLESSEYWDGAIENTDRYGESEGNILVLDQTIYN